LGFGIGQVEVSSLCLFGDNVYISPNKVSESILDLYT